MKPGYLVAALMVCCIPFAFSDELSVLEEQALQNNPALESAQQKWEAARARAGGARSLPDPMIGADWERDSTRFQDRMDIEYMAQQDLPGWGKRGARTRAAQLAADAEGFRYLEAVRGLRSDVAQAWWELWARSRTVEAMSGNIDAMRQVERAALSRYESGAGQLAEVLRTQAGLARMTNDWLAMQREVDVARVALNRLVNAPLDTPREAPADPADPGLPPSLETLQRQARLYCCILMSFLREQEAKAELLRAARVDRRPDWQLRVEARQFEGSQRVDEFDTGIFMNIPWLWRGKYTAAIREADAERAMAEAELRDEINKTSLEIQELYTRAESAQQQYHAIRDAVLPRLREARDSILAAYQAGQATFLDVQEAAGSVRASEGDGYRARATFAQTVTRLDAIAAPWGDFERSTGLISDDMK